MPTYSLNRLPSRLRWHVTLVMMLTLFEPGIATAEAVRRVRDVGDAQIAQLINEGIHMSLPRAGNPGRRPESHPSSSREVPARAEGAHRRDWA